MSVAELKRAADELSPAERLELAAYLRHWAKEKNPFWRSEIGRRLDQCLEACGHSSGELRETHQRLSFPGE